MLLVKMTALGFAALAVGARVVGNATVLGGFGEERQLPGNTAVDIVQPGISSIVTGPCPLFS